MKKTDKGMPTVLNTLKNHYLNFLAALPSWISRLYIKMLNIVFRLLGKKYFSSEIILPSNRNHNNNFSKN